MIQTGAGMARRDGINGNGIENRDSFKKKPTGTQRG